MIAMLLAAAASSGIAAFRADFPGASVVESPSGGRLTSASGFEARDLGESPQAAARAFLVRYGAAFGISRKQRLVLRDAAPEGQLGRVRFGRKIDGLPVFDGDIVVGVAAGNAVILVNASDVPGATSGRFRVSRKTAIRLALKELPKLTTSNSPRACRGWKAVGSALRPAWRVDLTAERPPGDWRTYVDAQTGKVVLRTNRRSAPDPAGPRPAPGSLEKTTP